MGWFLGEQWLVILLSFILGVIVGYWWWRRWWTEHKFSESEAVTRVTREHSELIARKDAEISRLRGLLDTDQASGTAGATGTVAGAAGTLAATGAAVHAAVDTPADATVDTGIDATADTGVDTGVHAGSDVAGLDADVSSDVHDAQVAAYQAAHPIDEVGTAALVDVDGIDVPSIDTHAHGGDLGVAAGVDSGVDSGVDVDAAHVPSVDVSAGSATLAGMVGVPAQAVHEGTGEGAHTGGDGPAVIDLAGADNVAEDDLERIEGIGPRISGALHTAGIHTFRALADSDVAALQAALEAAGLRFAPSLPTWGRQARLLADGDEAGFIALTEQLIAGRDPGRGA